MTPAATRFRAIRGPELRPGAGGVPQPAALPRRNRRDPGALDRVPDQTCHRLRIVEPAPIEDLTRYYKDAEAEFGVPWYYLASIHLVETRMGRIRGVSVAGAQGPMQFMPGTWAAYGEGDVNSDRDAIRAAARYLKANRAPADMPMRVRYNNSQRTSVPLQRTRVMKAERWYAVIHWQVFT